MRPASNKTKKCGEWRGAIVGLQSLAGRCVQTAARSPLSSTARRLAVLLRADGSILDSGSPNLLMGQCPQGLKRRNTNEQRKNTKLRGLHPRRQWPGQHSRFGVLQGFGRRGLGRLRWNCVEAQYHQHTPPCVSRQSYRLSYQRTAVNPAVLFFFACNGTAILAD